MKTRTPLGLLVAMAPRQVNGQVSDRSENDDQIECAVPAGLPGAVGAGLCTTARWAGPMTPKAEANRAEANMALCPSRLFLD